MAPCSQMSLHSVDLPDPKPPVTITVYIAYLQGSSDGSSTSLRLRASMKSEYGS